MICYIQKTHLKYNTTYRLGITDIHGWHKWKGNQSSCVSFGHTGHQNKGNLKDKQVCSTRKEQESNQSKLTRLQRDIHESRPMRDFKSPLPEKERSRMQNSTDTAELNSSIITAYVWHLWPAVGSTRILNHLKYLWRYRKTDYILAHNT